MVESSYWNALLANWKIWTIPQVGIVLQTLLHSFCKSSSDCEHQPGGSAVQGALRQPGRPRVELLPRLHQEKIGVDGGLFFSKESVPHCMLLDSVHTYLNEIIVFSFFFS